MKAMKNCCVYNITLVPVMIRSATQTFEISSIGKWHEENDFWGRCHLPSTEWLQLQGEQLVKKLCSLNTSWLSEITKLGLEYMLEYNFKR